MKEIYGLYKYTGPTVLIGEHDGIELRKGNRVSAEVNINIATVYKIYSKCGPTVLNDDKIAVAAKYLEPVKSETIGFTKCDWDGPAQEVVDMIMDHVDKIHEDTLASMPYLMFKDVINGIHPASKSEKEDHHEVGGDHYKMAIEPWDYIYANRLPFDEGSVVKYISRHKSKNGAEDVKKAISFCEHILKTHMEKTWIKVDKDHQPKPYQRVVGLWEEQSMICYLSREGDWCDELHRCYCYTAPKYFAYLPEGFDEE